MKNFNYTLKFKTKAAKGSCSGTCQAKNIEDAEAVVRSGVAKDLTIPEDAITEINLSVVKKSLVH